MSHALGVELPVAWGTGTGRASGRARVAVVAWLVTIAVLGAVPVRAQQPPGPPPRDTAARQEEPAPSVPALGDTVAPPAPLPARPARGDSIRPKPPVTPGGAFLRSLAIPGWGQARLGRNVTGGLFLLCEGVAGAMVWKASWQLEWARTRDKFVASHRQEREDWIVLLVFNHLMSATEAYVSALLYDFPVALNLRRLPGGGTGVGVSVPLR
jgi:hypothetical protein